MKLPVIVTILLLLHILVPAQDEWEIINAGITEPLHDIEFVSDRIGFIYSYGTGNIYQTTDEGSTWTIIKQTDSIYFEQIQFINPNLGWICGEKGKVLRTTDCGRTWMDLSIEVNDKNLLLYGMCFINETVGYISGAELHGKKWIPKVYITNDEGITWNETLKDFPHMILNLKEKDNVMYATGNGFIIEMNIQNHERKYVFRDTLGIIGQIRDIEFADDTFGLAVSFTGKILITTNGGESFSYNEITTNRLRSIAYLGEQTWIAVGDNNANDGAVLHASKDNGNTWQKNNDFPDIHRIHLTENHIWIVGKNGLIAKMRRN